MSELKARPPLNPSCLLKFRLTQNKEEHHKFITVPRRGLILSLTLFKLQMKLLQFTTWCYLPPFTGPGSYLISFYWSLHPPLHCPPSKCSFSWEGESRHRHMLPPCCCPQRWTHFVIFRNPITTLISENVEPKHTHRLKAKKSALYFKKRKPDNKRKHPHKCCGEDV